MAKVLRHSEALLARLDAIAAEVKRRNDAWALLALGSCGLHTHRLDEYSDLDFFLIVAPGCADAYIQDLSWLQAPSALVFMHRNTRDGWKALSTDGVFYEFAVFEPARLGEIPFAQGRIVWAREGIDLAALEPKHAHGNTDRDWLAAEALTNTYVALGRHLRGERIAAWHVFASSAVSAAICAIAPHEPEEPFNAFRRLEKRGVVSVPMLEDLTAGYNEPARCARAITTLLSGWRGAYPSLFARIEMLIDESENLAAR